MCFSSLLISCTVIKATPLNISALKIFSMKAPIELLMLIFCIFKWLSPSSIPKHECQSLVCCDLTLTSVAAVSSYGTERQRFQISASTSQVTVWILKRHYLKKKREKRTSKKIFSQRRYKLYFCNGLIPWIQLKVTMYLRKVSLNCAGQIEYTMVL